MRVAHSRPLAIAALVVAIASLKFTASYLAAPSPPIVREEEMRAEVTRDAVTITTPITRRGGSFHGTFTVELLDTSGSSMAGGSLPIEFERGESNPVVRILWPQFEEETDWEERRDLLMWTRVRYHLTADKSKDCASDEITGVRALGPIVKDLFALRVIAPSQPAQETPAQIRVFAENPFTGEPLSGVRMQAALYPESDDEKERAAHSITRTGVTRNDGGVSWDVTVPPVTAKDRKSEVEYKLKLAGVRGVVRIENEQEIDFNRRVTAIVTTDKPLYQPGQPLHIRTLVFDPGSRRPRSAEPIRIQIEDEAYKTVFERDITTDRFGVAFSDWMIPGTAPLGRYSIEIQANDGDNIGTANVRLSRYELPTFVANVEPDLPFYLPGQDARVRVSARFVYGEPVKSGHVRIAREESRSWNFKEQKWDVTEEGVWEGDSDSEGVFQITIPLQSEHAALSEDKNYQFRDPEYVARYTETASGRSEERRFRLRASKQAIHVYAISPDGRQHAGLPLRFYVVTSYADGAPAQCDLSVFGRVEEKSQPAFTYRARTDEHGIALIESAPAGYLSTLRLDISAQDGKGKSGTFEDALPISDGEGLRVKTPRVLYHHGEPLRVEIQSTIPTLQRLFVELLADNRIIRTETVKVLDHHASIDFAPGRDLSGQVTIVAYDPGGDGEMSQSRDLFAARTVLYPSRRALDLEARFDRSSVKPGEPARAFLSSAAPDGRARETSLGVVVYDSAVEERERTESESGQGRNYFGEYYARFFNWYASLSDVSLRELEELDESQTFPSSLELTAEALLQRTGGNYPYRSYAERVGSDASRSPFSYSLNPIRDTVGYILDRQSATEYPRDAPSLFALLARHGVELARTTDMWGNPYYAKFDVAYDKYALSITSAGPDEQRGTRDDFDLIAHQKPFFDPAWAQEIKETVDRFANHRGRLPRSAAEVILEMISRKARFLSLKEPWGTPYRLLYEPSTIGPSYEMEILSAGPDRKFDQGDRKDDIAVFKFQWNWFHTANESISRALTARFIGTHRYPASEAEFITVLKEAGLDFASLRDPWDQPLRINVVESTGYTVRPRIERVAATLTAPMVDKTTLEPVTQRVRRINLSASVPKVKQRPGYPNEFRVASYSQVIGEESRADALVERAKPASFDTHQEPARRAKSLATGLAGAVTGVVVDANGSVISGAALSLTNSVSGALLTATTDDTGFYAFVGLAPGRYSLRADVPGFNSTVIESIEVRLSTTVTVDLTMQVGGVSEMVTVTQGDAAVLQTQVAALALNVRNVEQLVLLQPGVAHPNIASTPRLRQDFPETLLWQPSLITDSQGKAEIKFNVADSITTWRMAVIGSTEDGLIGSATADLRAFQPFFVEHQPPPSLTIGDQIQTPVVVRNYQDRAADVKVKLASAPWMELLSETEQSIHAGAQGSATALASFKAIAAGDFKQEASAIGVDDGDRVAKPIAVRFDGRDTWRTYADLFQRETSFDVNIPEETIPGSSHVEMKIYPDLFAHALEGIEGIVRRPHGCLEQTTSAGYANLIVLQYLKRTGRPLPTVEQKASRNLAEALASLRSFADPEGGYFYFTGSTANLALTAYVLRFLTEAREFGMVDPNVIEAARQYLARAQRADGALETRRYSGEPTTREDTTRLTALVARALAASEPTAPEKAQPSTPAQPNRTGNVTLALGRSLDWLARATREFDDPYALSLYVLAAHDGGRIDAARESAQTLAGLAQPEAGGLFWDLQSNTPFYGWGRAGRLETTGLAVEALNTVAARRPSGSTSTAAGEADALGRALRRGVLFIIKNKDEYGVWYSTQATVNVLHGLIAVASQGDGDAPRALKLAISVDEGNPAEVEIPIEAGTPYELDLTTLLPQLGVRPGAHRVRLRTDSARTISAAIVARSSVPWVERDARGISEEGGLRLRVSYDRLDAKKGETINCAVHAERIGSAGYGMMLAEIGLPPGVDVDVASLRRAPVMKFDVTPDRVVLYLWPQAGGTDFSFGLTPRLRIKAATQPSLLYDYYNPDARVSIPPARFSVR